MDTDTTLSEEDRDEILEIRDGILDVLDQESTQNGLFALMCATVDIICTTAPSEKEAIEVMESLIDSMRKSLQAFSDAGACRWQRWQRNSPQ